MVVAAPNSQSVCWHEWIDPNGSLTNGNRPAVQRNVSGDAFSQPGQTAIPNDAEVA
jgi:hypothetical protein